MLEKNNYNKLVGNFGEDIAVHYLIAKGYKIVGRNIGYGHKELDIIAKFGNKLIFVEVKLRLSHYCGQADEQLTKRKLFRFKKAVSGYCQRYKINLDQVRLDLVAIDLDKISKIAKVKHYEEVA